MPRHLVLFNRDSLERALRQAGLAEVEFIPRVGATFNTFPVSRALAAGHARAIEAPRGALLERLDAAAIALWAMYFAPGAVNS